MDKNIDFNHLINNFREIKENNSFLRDMVSLNCSDQFNNKTDDNFESDAENQMPFINTTTGSVDPQEVSETNFSFQLLTDNLMDTKLTPTLVSKPDLSKRTNLFGFHNKKQLFVNNFCADTEDQKIEPKTAEKEVEDCDNYFDNSLGLSPVKKCHLNDYISSFSLKSFTNHSNLENIRDNGFVSSEATQMNNFSSNDKQLANDSVLDNDYSFKSVSKCSDIDLRAEEPKPDLNETFRPPNTDFQNKSISSYFKQSSEPISLMNAFNNSVDFDVNQSFKNDLPIFDKSFASVSDEINSSNTALEIVQKIIDRKNRKRKSVANRMSIISDQSLANNESFSPSLNSTVNSNEEMSDKSQSLYTKPSPPSIGCKSVVTSGVGTISTLGGHQHTYSMPNSNGLNSMGFSADLLSPNQSLIVSPNVLCLTIGCFADFKLNYLKIRNISITSFDVQIKVQANVDTLNSLEISVPNQTIRIPPLFDGILSDQITITPLKLGSFSVTLQLYASIENINLPLRPLSVICQIKTEEISIKRLLNYSNCLQIDYNLFENSVQNQTIDLRVSNRQIMNEIPLKLCLDSNKCIIFEPVYRHPESAIHVFRCSDPFTMHLTTKTQYEMQIPIKVQSVTGVQRMETSLTVCTDSHRSHVLAIFRLTATFWTKKELMEPLLQCSEQKISLKPNKWKEIHFRNKSKENLIRVELNCIKNDNIFDNSIKMSTTNLMIAPMRTSSIALLADQKYFCESESNYRLVIKYDSGFGKSFSYSLSIQLVSN